MTTLHITIDSREQLHQDALQFIRDVEADDLNDQIPVSTENQGEIPQL